jgi:hypothetical protein
MIDYGNLIHRLILKSETDEDINNLIDEIYRYDKKDLFVFIKSMALVIVNLQKDVKELKSKLAQSPEGLSDSSN